MRVGRYGEHRVINPGELVISDYEIFVDGVPHDCIRGLGTVSYQATTRGGRLMDNVLGNQATAKGFTSDFGDAMIQAAGQTDNAGAMLTLLAVGLISKGVSSAMTVEADIRAWQTLPNEFQVTPLQLPPGEHELTLCAYKYVTPLCLKTVRAEINGDAPLTVVHVFAYTLGCEDVATAFSPSEKETCALLAAQSGYRALDADGNGEITAIEIDKAYSKMVEQFDVDKNGKINGLETGKVQNWVRTEFVKGMIKR